MSTIYETDFHAWANEQAELLRTGNLSAADLQNIAEEIATLGRSEKRELVSRLTNLLHHRLTWQFQPGMRGASWEISINVAKNAINDHLEDNPSLKSVLPDAMQRAYRDSRLKAASETGLALSTFPEQCPWTFEDVMTGE